jgi:hypothetical protein
MSSPLAFDKQGNPFSFHRRTRQLRVRLFRNPSARGTCSHVLDADGSPLYIDADTEYPVFRQLVGNVPGLYRLDQCDDDGTEVDDAPAAYVTLDPPRNAQAFGTGSEEVSALAVIREMAAVQREMAAIQGQALKALADNHALILASAAEVMRAPRPAPVPAELRNAADDEDKNDDEYDDEYENDDADEEETSSGAGGLLAHLAKMIDPKDARELGKWLMAKYIQFRQETATAAQPAAPVNVAAAPVNVTATPNVATAPVVVQVPAPVSSPVITVATAATVTAPEVLAPDVTTALEPVSMSTAEPTTSEPTDDAAPESTGQIPPLTQDQLLHIAMITAQLSSEEQTIAAQVMRRMSAETQQRWLVELSAMSVEDATATVRQAIAERTQRRNKVTR